jgi:hypothetical protein
MPKKFLGSSDRSSCIRFYGEDDLATRLTRVCGYEAFSRFTIFSGVDSLGTGT